MSSVEERVKKIVTGQLSVKEDDITDDASFIEDLGADSLDIIEIMMAIENEFGLDIGEDDADKVKTFKEVVDFINANLE